jgi:hypothetical protein
MGTCRLIFTHHMTCYWKESCIVNNWNLENYKKGIKLYLKETYCHSKESISKNNHFEMYY